MRIAYCIPGLHNRSGMERALTLKANYLTAQGYDIHIILTDGAGKPPAFPLNSQIQVHQLDIDFEEPYYHPLLRRIWLYRRKMKKLKRKLNECLCKIQPDITVSLLRRDINVLDRMKDGSVKIGEIHFNRLQYRNFAAPHWMPSRLYAYLQHQWMLSLIKKLRKLSKFVVLTHEDAQYWPELNNVVVIPNPVSFMPDETSTCTNKQVIAVGRYVDQKGFDRLIAAWKQVTDKHPDWVLKIYGDGWLREQLAAQISELGLENSCFLEHSVANISDKYLESSVFALSSRFEGFGLVLVEAMACGLPVVSYTCHCGPRDIISDGENGILVPEGDIDGLAEGINRLIEDEELRKDMGRKARKKAEQYTIEYIGRQWMDLFETLKAAEE